MPNATTQEIVGESGTVVAEFDIINGTGAIQSSPVPTVEVLDIASQVYNSLTGVTITDFDSWNSNTVLRCYYQVSTTNWPSGFYTFVFSATIAITDMNGTVRTERRTVTVEVKILKKTI